MPQRPNILWIMADQHHAGCLGHRGHPDVRTPNLDRLAAEGTRFDNAFVQNGVCVPSRVSYLTGQYCHTHGVYGNDRDCIPASRLSLARYLQTFGYETACIGKKHLPGWPTHGFQYERLCYTADAGTRGLHYYNYLKQHGLHAWYDDLVDVEDFCLREKGIPREHSLEAWTGREAREYLQTRKSDAPFFAWVSFERPHPPLTVPAGCPFVYDPETLTLPENLEEVVPQSRFFFNRNVENLWCISHAGEKRLRQALAAYYALISLVDAEIGKLLDHLDAAGLAENTIVVYCADHGDFAGEYGRMAKGWMYDAIHRTPFLWRCPGRIRENARKEGLVESIDMAPTLCNLAGVPVPRTMQGRDLGALLAGEAESERDAVYFEFLGVKTVRTPTHKLSYGFDGKEELGELYDLRDDPHELRNRFDDPSCALVREALLRKLLDWWIANQQPANFAPGNEHLPPTRWFEEHDGV